MRLIYADALRARMYHDAFETDTDMQKWDGGCWIRYKMFENALNDAPTIEERKTGKWKKVSASRYMTSVRYAYKCSLCGDIYDIYSNYCPNCGADMRGV